MHRILALFVIVGAAVGQQQQHYGDPRNAAILSEQRYLSGDGSFGAQYTQEDGVQFKEESLPDGSRRGSYSYVDPTGQKRTVSYTAGKHGFHATGDHIPQAPPTVLPQAPKPQYKPLPQFNPPEQQYNSQPQQFNPPQQQYNPPQQQYNPPQQQYNPPQQQYNPPQQQYNPPPQQYNPPQQQYQQPSYEPQNYHDNTTPAPHRFYPPGKLSLNRSPDGFSYTFNKV